MIWFEIWWHIAVIGLISSVPVTYECLCDVFDRSESFWNRRAAILWIPVMWVACALWPLAVGALVWAGIQSLFEKNEVHA